MDKNNVSWKITSSFNSNKKLQKLQTLVMCCAVAEDRGQSSMSCSELSREYEGVKLGYPPSLVPGKSHNVNIGKQHQSLHG